MADLFVLVPAANGNIVSSSEKAARFDAGRVEVFDIGIDRRGCEKKEHG